MTTFDGRAMDYVMEFPRPSPSVFANCKRSKTEGVEGLRTWLRVPSFKDNTSVVGPHASKGCAPVLGVSHWPIR